MIKFFEEFHLTKHLQERGIDPSKYSIIIVEESNDTYFFIYNLSGEIIGYQKYNPFFPKKGQRNNIQDTKYYNYVADEDSQRKIAVWGLESYNFTDKYLFITEGIFDAARIHQAGYPCIAVLCNNPSDQTKEWLKTLPQIKIVIKDNDDAGDKLITSGDYSFSIDASSGKDINDLSIEEAKDFLDNIISDLEN